MARRGGLAIRRVHPLRFEDQGGVWVAVVPCGFCSALHEYVAPRDPVPGQMLERRPKCDNRRGLLLVDLEPPMAAAS